jgi:dTDP-4-dehydrorhamnose reductase
VNNILVLGGGGMLGHKMFQTLRVSFPDVFVATRPGRILPFLDGDSSRHLHCDALQLESVRELLTKLRPSTVVNCVGIIKQRSAVDVALPTICINAVLPHFIADVLSGWGGRLVHISTDCVFSGGKGNYTEEDQTDAKDLYGKTKAIGEVSSVGTLTIRTSIIGRELDHFASLLEWFFQQRGRRVLGYRRAIFSGVSTNYLAQFVAAEIGSKRPLTGLFHMASEPISKYELLELVKRAYSMDVEIVPDDAFECDRSLNDSKLRSITQTITPNWSSLLDELINDHTPYEDWRKNNDEAPGR